MERGQGFQFDTFAWEKNGGGGGGGGGVKVTLLVDKIITCFDCLCLYEDASAFNTRL